MIRIAMREGPAHSVSLTEPHEVQSKLMIPHLWLTGSWNENI